MKKEDIIPEFDSVEKEKEYWLERAKAPGKWTENKPQKRSSFLAVRLTGEEITKLRDAAAGRGMSLSKFARQALVKDIEGDENRTITLNQAIELLASDFTDEDRARLQGSYANIAVPLIPNPISLCFDKKDVIQMTAAMVRNILGYPKVLADTDKSIN